MVIKRYIVPDKKLNKYNASKSDAKKGIYKRPDDKYLVTSEPNWKEWDFDVDVDPRSRTDRTCEEDVSN